MLVIRATIPLDPDGREEALELATDLAEQSREEEGVIEYQVATDVEDPNLLRFFEQYEDEAAFGAHAQSEHFQEFQQQLPDLVGGAPEVIRYDVESSEELEL